MMWNFLGKTWGSLKKTPKDVWNVIAYPLASLIQVLKRLDSLWGTVVIINLVYALVCLIIGIIVPVIKIGDTPIVSWGWILFAFQIFYNLASLQKVKPPKRGVLLLFGKPIREVGPGLVYAPLIVTELVKIKTTVIEIELPGEPERIWHGDPAIQSIPPGMVPPIRIIHAESDLGETSAEKSDKNRDPLRCRLTIELSLFFRIQLDDLISFLLNIGSIKELVRQMDDTLVSMAFSDLAKKTPTNALANIEEVNQKLHDELEVLVHNKNRDGKELEKSERWGVTVLQARIKLIQWNHTLNQAIADLPKSRFEAKTIEVKARAEKIKRTMEGKGDAAAHQAMLIADATGKALQKKKLGVAGEDLLAMETLRGLGEKGNQTLIAGDWSGLVQATKVIGASIQAENKKGATQ